MRCEYKKLSSAFNYDILFQPHYKEAFSYIPSFLKGRLYYIASDVEVTETQNSRKSYHNNEMSEMAKLTKKCQSDYVRLVIDLAHVPDGKSVTLTTEALMDRVMKARKIRDT